MNYLRFSMWLNRLDLAEILTENIPYVLSLNASACKDDDLTGGKGSSLAVLTEISKQVKDHRSFTVPSGFVVTTEAFKRFMQSPRMAHVRSTIVKVYE